jgi:glucosamine--fructose-6-phosphate aminotransferase (isomerizing)
MSQAGSLLTDIVNQPRAWTGVIDYHLGSGRSALLAAGAGLRGTGHLVLSGMGASHFACISLQNRLAQRGVASFVIDTSELLHHQYQAFGHAAAVVLVSRSGETVEAVKSLPLLKARGAKVVAVTNEPGSTLAHQADHAIWIGSPADHLGVAVQTYSCTALCLYLLGSAILAEPDADQREHLTRFTEVMNEALDPLVQASREWPAFLAGAHAIHLLGRGASIGSTMEGAILFNEVSKVAALPMGSSLFRHGPVEVVDKQFRAIVFAPPGRTRELDLALVRDLTHLGVATRWIGPALNAADPISPLGWTYPDIHEDFASLAEILPVQFAALRFAEARGVSIGQFRIAGTVTLAESGFAAKAGFQL